MFLKYPRQTRMFPGLRGLMIEENGCAVRCPASQENSIMLIHIQLATDTQN